MKNLFLLLFLFAQLSFSQAVVLDGRSGTTEITPSIGVKTKTTPLPKKTRAVGAAAKTVANVQVVELPVYTLDLNFAELRILRQRIAHIAYQEDSNPVDEAAFNAVRDHVKTNKDKKGAKPKLTLTVSKSIMDNLSGGGYYDDTTRLKDRFQEEMQQARFYAKVNAQKKAQEAAVSVKK